MKNIDYTLYFITDSTGRTDEEICSIVEKACEGGVRLVQLREKIKTGREYLETAIKVKRVTDRYNAVFIIDDRADIALACNADGVHLGRDDMPIAYARKIMGEDKIVGATAKTVEAALKAERDGADYLGTGAIYPTTTKVKTVLTDVSTLREITNSVNIPVCAIGGLNYSNCDILKDSGISGICVVSAIMKSTDPEGEARRLITKVKSIIC